MRARENNVYLGGVLHASIAIQEKKDKKNYEKG